MKRKGFTTIELLLVVALIVTVSLVAVVSYTMINNKQKQKDYDVMVKNIKTAAELYISQNRAVEEQLKTNGQVSVPILSLVNTGNLEEYYTTNPKNKTSVLEMCVYAIVGEELNNGIRNINYSEPTECGGYLVLSDLNLYLFRLEEYGIDVLYNPVIKVIDENGTILLNNASKEEYIRGGVEAKTIDNEKELELENLTKGCHTAQFHYEEKIFDRKVCVEDIGYCEIKIKTDEGEETIDKIAHGESIIIDEYVTVEEGLEIDLYYKRNVYTLNLSKGTGVSSITATGCTEVTAGSVYTCAYGASVTVTATASTGYTINSTLTGTNIANKTNGTAFTMPVPTSGTSVTLTASAAPKDLTVTFDVNGGSGSNTTKTVTYGQTYGTLASAPSKSCATFAGWYTAASGGNLVTASTEVTNGAPHTLYAHYNANTSGGTWGSCTGGYCSGCSAASNSGQQTNTCGATRSCTPSASSLECNKNGSITSDCDDDCGYTYCKTTCGGEVYTNLGSCAPTISCSVSISPNRFTYNKSVSLSTWYITARTTVSGTYNVRTTGYKNGGYCDVNTNLTAGNTYNISGLTTNYCTSTTIDVTSSRSGSKTIYFTITHNSTGTYKTCSWTYSWS